MIDTNKFKQNGSTIESFTLNSGKAAATIINYGAIIQKFVLIQPDGTAVDVVLGFDDPFCYVENGKVPGYPFLGAFVGRACNRTEKGAFNLNGQSYQLPINNGPNSLHGGTKGFDKQFFTSSIVSHDPPSISLEYTSPHLDQGFPGKILVKVQYTLVETSLNITTSASLVDDHVKETYVNLTSHPYFNLSGCHEPTVTKNYIQMSENVSGVMELNDVQIPTGKILTPATNPEYFFHCRQELGQKLTLVQKFRGYDHFYLVQSGGDSPWITITCPQSLIGLQVTSSSSGFQFYTGNWLDGKFSSKSSQAKDVAYGQYSGFCVEPSEPPNSINMPSYSKLVTISKDKEWNQTISYKLFNQNEA